MAVLLWSLRVCVSGAWPSCRHDSQPWTPADRHRARHSGKSFPSPALLVEVRGDWVMYHDLFRLPAHNERAGLCWLCSCTPTTLRHHTYATYRLPTPVLASHHMRDRGGEQEPCMLLALLCTLFLFLQVLLALLCSLFLFLQAGLSEQTHHGVVSEFRTGTCSEGSELAGCSQAPSCLRQASDTLGFVWIGCTAWTKG